MTPTAYNLNRVTPPMPGGLSSTFSLVDQAQAGKASILVVSFTGDYPPGSLGNAHGRYIAATTLHGVEAFAADCVILDFRDMTYAWGNTLLKVYQVVSLYKDIPEEPDCPPFPVLTVTSKKSRDAFVSLVTPNGGSPPSSHFADLNAAIEAAIVAANKWLAI